MAIEAKQVTGAALRLLRELLDGADPRGAWVINRGDAGLLDTLDRVTAEQASARAIPGRSTLAGHANHLRFSLELLNRWARGEEPFEDADWEGSWAVQTVGEAEWRALRDALRAEVRTWIESAPPLKDDDEMAITGVIASAAHVAYHFGAVRQLLGAVEAER